MNRSHSSHPGRMRPELSSARGRHLTVDNAPEIQGLTPVIRALARMAIRSVGESDHG